MLDMWVLFISWLAELSCQFGLSKWTVQKYLRAAKPYALNSYGQPNETLPLCEEWLSYFSGVTCCGSEHPASAAY